MKIKSKKYESLTLDEKNKFLKKQKRGSKIVSFICKTAAIVSAVGVVATAITFFINPVTLPLVSGLLFEVASVGLMTYLHLDSKDDIKEIDTLLKENDKAKQKEIQVELSGEKTQQKEKEPKVAAKSAQKESSIEIQA